MRKTYPFIIAIVILSAFLVLSLYLGLSGHLFSLSVEFDKCDLTPGETVLVQLEKNNATTLSYCIDGAYLKDEKIPQNIKIRGAVDADLNVRVKCFFDERGNSKAFSVVYTEDFVYGNDGYYYLKEPIKSQSVLTFASDIILDADVDLYADENYIITFVFESLSDNIGTDIVWGIS